MNPAGKELHLQLFGWLGSYATCINNIDRIEIDVRSTSAWKPLWPLETIQATNPAE